MKNLKVSAKLLLGFGIIAAFTIAIGLAGVISLLTMDATYTEAIETHGYPLAIMAAGISDLQNTVTDMRDAVILKDDPEVLREIDASARGDLQLFENSMEQYRISLADSDLTLFDSGMKIYHEVYKPSILEVLGMIGTGFDEARAIDILSKSRLATDDMVEIFNETMDHKLELLEKAAADNTALSTTIFTIVLIGAIVATTLAVFLGFYISGLISKPLITLAAFMNRAGTTGDITLSPEDVENIGKLAQAKDEIGQAIGGSAGFVGHVTNIAHSLGSLADGDFSIEVKTLSEADTMGQSLHKVVDNLSHMFADIQTSTTQVSSGSKQVADGAQSLAQGTTEQAAAIQQLSSSISEIAERTKANAATAERTSRLSATIKANAEKGSNQMDEMITAVKDINEASNSISKIIKTIDDIAFQTNILALNAAVEAARAGQHGKGFAVVAEEVRNLASKSAEAAKDTGNMIQNSMDKAELGTRIAGETAESLSEIVSGINESSVLVAEIAESSEAQSLGISQINTGIDQVAQVTQQNSATAEESAAASEEMSGQSIMLQQLISQFKIKGSETQPGLPTAARPARKQLDAPADSGFEVPVGNGDFGKY